MIWSRLYRNIQLVFNEHWSIYPNVYPVSAPVISIPRVRIKSKTKSYTGSTVTETYIPTSRTLVRPGFETINVVPGTNTNVFTATGLSAEQLRMNRRYTLITNLRVTEVDNEATPGTHVRDIPLTIRPDNRNQFVGIFTFTDQDNTVVTGNLNGHINYDNGIASFNTVITGGSTGHTYECNYATYALRFVPFQTMNGRTTVSIETEINC